MATYITDLAVSVSAAEEQELSAQGYNKINANLNQGAHGNWVYLWYKKGNAGAITQIQFTFSDSMVTGLIEAGFVKIPKDLNAGAGGNVIYVWYLRGSANAPVAEIDVTTTPQDDARKMALGWERSACDLNRYVTGNRIHTWIRRETKTYISEVTATDTFSSDAELFKKGYIRLDEDVNRGTAGRDVFIWFRLTTNPQKALNSLEVSTNDQDYQTLQQQGYTIVPVNLNEGNARNKVYLWHKKDVVHPAIQGVSVLVNTTVDLFPPAGVQVIRKNLNAGTYGPIMYLCFYQ